MHDEKIIEINGNKVKVDAKLAPLILELNNLGLKTTHSCQGGSRRGMAWKAYVSIKLDNNCTFDYYIEEGILTIRWNLPELQEKLISAEPIETSYLDTSFGEWKISEVLRILEREHKARFGNLPYKYKISRAEIVMAYEDARSKQELKTNYVSMEEIYLRLKRKYRLSIDDFRGAMVEFYDENYKSYEFAYGSCPQTKVKKYGFPAGGKWQYYMKRMP